MQEGAEIRLTLWQLEIPGMDEEESKRTGCRQNRAEYGAYLQIPQQLENYIRPH